jgi:drug/metabolite transporter (DMT)-like permease
MKIPAWLMFTAFSVVGFGLNAAFIEIPEKFYHPGFPTTLGYVVWSATMVACAMIAMQRARWRLQHTRAAVLYGGGMGLLGAGGQMLCFVALRQGPAYIIIPIVSLYPIVTVVLALLLLRERVRLLGSLGVITAFVAILLLSLDESSGPSARVWCIAAMLMWGTQGWLIKRSAYSLTEEGVFVYMAAGAIALAPIAVLMTDFSVPINYTLTGPWLAALIQFPNALAALLIIYAYLAGKLIIVAPIIALYPVITIVVSLLLYHRLPTFRTFLGFVIAIAAILLIVLSEISQKPSDTLTLETS